MTTDRIVEIESLSFRALPALEQQIYDGWILRLSAGYTGRANSVNPLYGSTLDINEKIAYCEAFYAQHNLPPLFKLTDAPQPDNLDVILSDKGYVYRENGHTHVLTADLTAQDYPIDPALVIYSSLSPEWFNAFVDMNHVPFQHRDTLWQMLHLIQTPCAYALLKRNDEPIGVALGVLDAGWMGIYDVVVSAEYRRKGYARTIVSGVMGWGAESGAKDSYLQVLTGNIPALNLYEDLGFAHAYDYWYRVKR
jgi:GNAT superfamily N-acetyltransferase